MQQPKKKRRLRVIAIERDPPDIDKLARALIQAAEEMVAKEDKAKAAKQAKRRKLKPSRPH